MSARNPTLLESAPGAEYTRMVEGGPFTLVPDAYWLGAVGIMHLSHEEMWYETLIVPWSLLPAELPRELDEGDAQRLITGQA